MFNKSILYCHAFIIILSNIMFSQKDVTSIVVDDAGRIIASTLNEGIIISTNGGGSWLHYNQGLPDVIFDLIISGDQTLIAAGNDGTIYRSTGYPSTWTEQLGNPIPQTKTMCLTKHSNESFIYAGFWGPQQIYRSTDDGITWHPISSNYPSSITETLLYLGGGKLIAGATVYGNQRSTDFGVSWNWANPNFFTAAKSIVSENSKIFIGTFDGVYLTTNFGDEWVPKNSGLSNIATLKLIYFNQTLLAATYGGIYKTTDDGNNWIWSNSGIEGTLIRELSFYDGVIYAGAENGSIFKSTNGGNFWIKIRNRTNIPPLEFSWIKVSSGIDIHGINQFEVSKNNKFWMAANSGMYYSNTNGYYWNLVHSWQDFKSVIAVDDTIFTAYNYGIYKSTDNGLVWDLVFSKPLYGLLKSKNNKLYVISLDTLFISENFGLTWESKSILPAEVVTAYSVSDSGNVYIGTNQSNVYILKNNETTFYKCTQPINYGSIQSLGCFNENEIYVGTDNGFRKSENLGLNWSTFTLTSTRITSIVRSDSVYIFAGNTEMNYTTNFGLSWETNVGGLPSNFQITALFFDNGGYLNLGKENGEVYRSSIPINSHLTKIDNKLTTVFSSALKQNYPNPFNPVTTISYQIKEPGLVQLKVFNVLGQEVTVLVNEVKSEGSYSINFDASNLPSGVYIYSLRVNNFIQNNKMTLLK